jgi:hypothetical protein
MNAASISSLWLWAHTEQFRWCLPRLTDVSAVRVGLMLLFCPVWYSPRKARWTRELFFRKTFENSGFVVHTNQNHTAVAGIRKCEHIFRNCTLLVITCLIPRERTFVIKVAVLISQANEFMDSFNGSHRLILTLLQARLTAAGRLKPSGCGRSGIPTRGTNSGVFTRERTYARIGHKTLLKQPRIATI